MQIKLEMKLSIKFQLGMGTREYGYLADCLGRVSSPPVWLFDEGIEKIMGVAQPPDEFGSLGWHLGPNYSNCSKMLLAG